MHYRYYIGLSLPTDISERIASVQAKLYNPRVAIRPLEPHITLLPPPAVEHIAPETLSAQAKQAAQPYLPVTLALTNIQSFGGHAVVIDIESEVLHQLQSKLTSLLPDSPQVARFYKRPFRPHVTLIQAIRGTRLPETLTQQCQEELAGLLPTTCSIDQLTLYRWLKPRTYKAEVL